MLFRTSHEIRLAFEQLRWLERRRQSIIDCTAAHFGRDKIRAALPPEDRKIALPDHVELEDLLVDSTPEECIRALARKLDALESRTVARLMSRVSEWESHVEEQIFFGARLAGQEAARWSIEHSHCVSTHRPAFLAEVVQVVNALTWSGLESEKNNFLSIRPLSDATMHFVRSPHMAAWKEGGAEPLLMARVKNSWVRGILDILGGGIEYNQTHYLESGAPFGLEEFRIRPHAE
ncbi:MAG: hypothetical protein HUU37_11450 [Bdellovibrionales bacterium]|nr:hypothetical protein [Bdellovibrionales bacterium]